MPQIRPRIPQVLGEGQTVNSVFDALQVPALTSTAPVTSTWPTSRIFAVPFRRASPWVLTQLWWHNGTVSATNLDCGVYIVGHEGGLTLFPGASTGSTAQGTSSVVQSVNIPDVVLPSGLFYMALSCTSGSTAFFRTNVAASNLRMFGVVSAPGAVPLPATLTPVATTYAYLPVFGIATRPAAV